VAAEIIADKILNIGVNDQSQVTDRDKRSIEWL